jgi:hypothetical protein
MKYNTHASDLYCLPESDKEVKLLQGYSKKYCGQWSRSNVKGQDWYGKTFLDIPFGTWLKDEIDKAVQNG